MFNIFFEFARNPNTGFVLKILYQTAFIWLPAMLLVALWDIWIMYRRAQFFAKKEYVVLEVKIPRDIFKSPLAMEFFIDGLNQPFGEANWYEKYWKGQTVAWFSLEIAAINGGIHFFIWSRKEYKNRIEANLYSQFPGIEIYEVPDYTLPVTYNPEVNGLWSTEFYLTDPDVFPIKTYIDYGLDKDPDEEYKIDPMTPLIEFMGSLGKEHQAWVQIVIRVHRAEHKDPETGKMVDKKWKKAASVEIDKILAKTKSVLDKEGKMAEMSRIPTKGESEIISALERSISKKGFDVGIRAVYTAPKDLFDPNNIGGIIGCIANFNSPLNGFKPSGALTPKYQFKPLAWKNRKKSSIDYQKRSFLYAYKNRGFYYNEFKRKPFVLNTEELATLWHFPGGVSTTPTFSRIESKKFEAPSNLPV